MSIAPEEFCSLAKQLSNDNDYKSETVRRTVIGRIYYGCFLKARNKFGVHGLNLKKRTEIHQLVAMNLTKYDPKLGDFLKKLRKKRNKADYDIHLTITDSEVNFTILIADQLLLHLN